MGVEYITGSDVVVSGNLTVLGSLTGNVTVSGSSFAQIIDTGLTPYGFIYPGYSGLTGGLFVSTAAATNGQILIGSTGFAPVAGTITGTANQVIVTNGPGTITLSAPQSLSSTSTPTFTNCNLSDLTTNGVLYAGASGAITSTAAMINGQILIGSTSATPVLGTITGTANEVIVTNGAGTITLSTPQAIAITSSVTFGSITNSSLTQNGFMYAGNGGLEKTTSAATNGQILIGSTGSAPVAASITPGTAISVTNAAGSITINNTGVTALSGGTDINVSSATGNVTVSTVGQFATTTVTTNSSSLSATNTYVGVNFAGAVTINLPSGSSVVQGKYMLIKDESGNASTNNITVLANGTDKIDGQSSAILALNYGSITVIWNTNHWSII